MEAEFGNAEIRQSLLKGVRSLSDSRLVSC